MCTWKFYYRRSRLGAFYLIHMTLIYLRNTHTSINFLNLKTVLFVLLINQSKVLSCFWWVCRFQELSWPTSRFSQFYGMFYGFLSWPISVSAFLFYFIGKKLVLKNDWLCLWPCFQEEKSAEGFC